MRGRRTWWRRYRAKVRCFRKGHEFQRFMEPPYERCLRCGRVPKHVHRGATASVSK